jgi:hypothetical protein
MKSDTLHKIGVIDALTAGLTMVARRPWLIVIPVATDLILWLAPRVSINNLVLKFFAVWEALLRAAYTPAQVTSMGDMITTLHEVVTHFGAETNLAEAIAGNWLGPSSALLVLQSTRQTFISDTLLAPLGLSLDLPRMAAAPWQAAPIEINNFWAAALIFAVLWLIGQLLVAVYYFQCRAPLTASYGPGASARARPEEGKRASAASPVEAQDAGPRADGEPLPAEDSQGDAANSSLEGSTPDPPDERPAGLRSIPALAVRLTVFSLLLSVGVLLLRLPLAAALLMTVFSGGAGAGILFALVGGITLWALMWFLTSLYFSSEGIVFEGQSIWHGALQSLLMVRGQVLSTFGLVLTINVVLLGFRAVWGLIGNNPLGGTVAILGNAFLTTSMLLAIFVYFGDVRRRWHARQARAFGSLARRNSPRNQ